MKKVISEEQVLKVLDAIYDRALTGIKGVSKPVDNFAEDYIETNATADDAAEEMIRRQIIKCGASGFVTSLGGLLTLPAAIPANVGSVLYIQMRMVAAVAIMGGFDVYSDQVRALVYACLTGTNVEAMLEDNNINTSRDTAGALAGRIPMKVVSSINRVVAKKLARKMAADTAFDLIKVVPVISGVLDGGVDALSTKKIADSACQVFLQA